MWRLSMKKIIVFLFLLFVLCFFVSCGNNEKYHNDFCEVQRLLEENIESSKLICLEYLKKWTKHIEMESKTGIGGLYPIEESLSLIKEIYNVDGVFDKLDTNKIKIDELMKEIQRPPKEYEKAYGFLLELYGEEIEFRRLADLSGESYNSFSEKFTETDDNCSKLLSQIKISTPEKK